jgi:uncharacterized protein DUF1905
MADSGEFLEFATYTSLSFPAGSLKSLAHEIFSRDNGGFVADKAEFDAELIEGHKGVTVVIVPFDPEEGWSQKPVRLGSRRHGWLITGTVNGVRFDGYIGERWGRFFIIIDPELRKEAGVSVGDTLRIIIQPTSTGRVFERAVEQSKMTTQPRTARPDAIDPRGTARRKVRSKDR